jgi:hypothetical protein
MGDDWFINNPNARIAPNSPIVLIGIPVAVLVALIFVLVGMTHRNTRGDREVSIYCEEHNYACLCADNNGHVWNADDGVCKKGDAK